MVTFLLCLGTGVVTFFVGYALGADDQLSRETRGSYWRAAYEELVKQTGRDLNDGYGPDPRKPK